MATYIPRGSKKWLPLSLSLCGHLILGLLLYIRIYTTPNSNGSSNDIEPSTISATLVSPVLPSDTHTTPKIASASPIQKSNDTGGKGDVAGEVNSAPELKKESFKQTTSYQNLEKPPPPIPEVDNSNEILKNTRNFFKNAEREKLAKFSQAHKEASNTLSQNTSKEPSRSRSYADGLEAISSTNKSTTYRIKGLFGVQCVTKLGYERLNAHNAAVHACNDDKLEDAYQASMKKHGLRL